MINESKPTTSLTNSDKVVQYETFDTLITTFDTETRTFDEMATTWTNQIVGLTELFFSHRRFPLKESTPFLSGAGITNLSKPV